MSLSEKEAKNVLKGSILSKREEIEAVASKIVTGIPDMDRWFIQLDELVNFPRILQTWYNYFFLDQTP